MTATNVMDIISRLPGCSGQTAYAVSAYTEENVTISKFTQLQNWNAQTFGFVYHGHNGRNHGAVWETVVPSERNLYGHPLAGLLWERQFEKFPLQYGWKKFSN